MKINVDVTTYKVGQKKGKERLELNIFDWLITFGYNQAFDYLISVKCDDFMQKIKCDDDAISEDCLLIVDCFKTAIDNVSTKIAKTILDINLDNDNYSSLVNMHLTYGNPETSGGVFSYLINEVLIESTIDTKQTNKSDYIFDAERVKEFIQLLFNYGGKVFRKENTISYADLISIDNTLLMKIKDVYKEGGVDVMIKNLRDGDPIKPDKPSDLKCGSIPPLASAPVTTPASKPVTTSASAPVTTHVPASALTPAAPEP